MTTADRLYAAEQLLGFLQRVGPREAVWAMTTALEALDAPGALASGDHLAAAVRAFDAAVAETEDLAKAPAPRGKKSPAAAAAPATNGEQQ